MRQLKHFFWNAHGRELPELDALPNGLRISCRERATQPCQNANDRAREAVGWNFHDRKRVAPHQRNRQLADGC
jgi:hypothetical protein